MTGDQPQVRRLGPRRVVYGELPDPNQAVVRDETLAAAADGERAESWGDASPEHEEDRWLKAQRPPHWG